MKRCKKKSNNKGLSEKYLKEQSLQYNTIYVNEKHESHPIFYNMHIHTFKGVYQAYQSEFTQQRGAGEWESNKEIKVKNK